MSSDQISWEEFERLVEKAGGDAYGEFSVRSKRDALDTLRHEFVRTRAAVDERNSLREMLLDLGIENAKLSIDLAQEREFSKKPRQPAGFQVVGDSNGYGVATTYEEDELV